MTPRQLENPESTLEMNRIPTEWWLRPVRRQAPRRRAQGGGVEVRVAQAAGGQPVDVGGVDVGPVATEVGEAGVVEHDDHDVGGAAGWAAGRFPVRGSTRPR